jgi:hypothetical protein
LFYIFEEEEEEGFVKHGIFMELKEKHFDLWKSFIFIAIIVTLNIYFLSYFN